MTSTIAMLGVDFRLAPLAVREQLSFSSQEQRKLLPSLTGPEVDGAFLLSTCNRTELYLSLPAPPLPARREAALGGALAQLQQFRPQAASACETLLHTSEWDESAVAHLFRVASGIDSQILGDTNIVQQIKQAHRGAEEAGTLSTLLNRMLTDALRAGKRARRETAIGRGSASVGAAVLRSIRGIFPDTAGLRVLVLGGGDACQDIARQICKAQFGDVAFASRTPEQAAGLARAFGAKTLSWLEVDSALPGMDVVIAATSARLPQLEASWLRQYRPASASPLLVVDVGVPRNADAGLRALENVRLIDLDGLAQEEGEARRLRSEEVPRVEAILVDELDRWKKWRLKRATQVKGAAHV